MQKRNNRFRSVAGEAPAGSWYEVERPTGPPTVEGMVLVPLLQSLILGTVIGVLASWVLVEVLEVAKWWPATGVLSLACFGIAFVFKCSGAEATLWMVERTIGMDLDRDGAVGRPEAHIVTVAGPGASRRTPEEQKRVELVTFVRAVGATGDSARERFEPTIGRARYEEFRDALLRAGLARWIDPGNHRLGWDLAKDPEEIVRGIM